jgi:uncharacterized protein YggE
MKYAPFIVLLFVSVFAFSQSATDRLVEVTGEAELKIDANQVTLAVELREYKKEGKTVKIDEIESQVQKVLQAQGIPAENFKPSTSSKQTDATRRNPESFASRKYTLKVADPTQIGTIINELAVNNVTNVTIAEATSSDLDKSKNDAKLQAMNDAKQKATFLVTAAGGKLGRVQQIKELESNEIFPTIRNTAPRMNTPLANNNANSPGATTNANVSPQPDVKGLMQPMSIDQIRVTYKVLVKYAIE